MPDQNGEFGGFYVNAGHPDWYAVIENMTQASDGRCGLNEILTTTTGKGLGCDGIFMDTFDTCAPNTFSPLTQSEWTAPGFQYITQTIREDFPGAFIMQNRGVFFYNPAIEHFNFTTRPYIDSIFYESFYSDSNDFDTVSPFLNDNKYGYAPKINAEADREDGFTVLSLGYIEPRAVRDTIAVDGNISDWSIESKLQINGAIPPGNTFQEVWAANDANYVYLRIKTLAGTNLNSANFRIYFDTDDEPDTGDISAAGFEPSGAGAGRIRSELLLENTGLYSQDTGIFNRGQVGSATMASNGTLEEWEIRIPRNIVHPGDAYRYAGQNVFGADGEHFLMLLTYDTGTGTDILPYETFDKNVGYRLETGTGSVYDEDFEESQANQGWLLYETDKFLSLPPNTRTATWNTSNPDNEAPVWDNTSRGFVSPSETNIAPGRVGVQNLMPGDGQVTVQWDVANDQSRPVKYKIYYAPADPDPGNDPAQQGWSSVGPVFGERPRSYSYGSWTPTFYDSGSSSFVDAGVFANEYTVTGLENGIAYRFIVRAVDNAATPHEDSNSVYLETTPQISSGETYAGIVIDGDFSDWPSWAKIWEDPQDDQAGANTDVKAIWMANDSEKLYLRVDTWNSVNFPSDTTNNVYFDTDLDPSDIAYNPYGAGDIFSEALLQGAFFYSQGDGNFNDGNIQFGGAAATAAFAPASAATSFEYSFPRAMTHPTTLSGSLAGLPVFGADGSSFKVLVMSDNAGRAEVAGAATYTIARPEVWMPITIDGNYSDWPAQALVYRDPQNDHSGAASDFKTVWMANDSNNVYFRVETWNSHDLPNSFNNFYFDPEIGVAPGFDPFGLGKISSKLLLQGASLFSQGNGNWNDGQIVDGFNPVYASIAPGGSSTEWEFSIPRDIVHPSTAGGRAGLDVFGPDGSVLDMLLTSDNPGPAEFASDNGALRYKLASAPAITESSTRATIDVTDSSIDGWPSEAVVWQDDQNDNGGAPSDVKTVWLANDDDYIYMRIDTWNAHDYLSVFNNTYFDADLSAATGFNPHGLLFGSEMLLQGIGLYSQKNGGFNEGAATSPSSKTVAVYPTSGTASSWEWRIPRDLVHPSGGGDVFAEPDDSFFLLVTSDNAGAAELAPDNPIFDFIYYVPAAGPGLQMEAGTVSNVSGTWTTVNLANTYDSPVVVCVPQYANNSSPIVTRVRNVTAASFDVRLQNPGDLASVQAETVHYVVVEEGTWTLPGGAAIEAQLIESTLTDQDGSWAGQAASYDQSYTAPVVLGQVMTQNDPDWSVFWCSNGNKANPPTASALEIGKTVCEDTDTKRANETLGVIVIEAGNGSIGGVGYEADLGIDTIQGIGNAPPYSYTFNQSFGSTPAVAVATQAAMDGGNGGWAVLYGSSPLTASTLRLAIDEDQIKDSERSHVNEQVGYFVFESAFSYTD